MTEGSPPGSLPPPSETPPEPRSLRAPVKLRATYRLQLGPDFGFDRAASLAGYLSALGVSHAYLSPVLQASPGSTHGYDVVDHRAVSKELGGPEAHARFCEELGRAELGQIVDIVPNHMAVVPQNPLWWDVLENGPSSLYASFFDVEWEAPEERLRSKVMMPILGDHSGRVIEAGEIRVLRDGGTFTCHYHEHSLPVAPRSLEGLLTRAATRAGSADLAFIAESFALLPPPAATDPESSSRRHRDKEVLRRQLARLTSENPEVARAIDGELAVLSSDPDALDDFLARQIWRLAYWRTAARDLGYRRFFDINSLVGLRTEDKHVFLETHALLLSWLAEGVIDGVRVDHVDGLRDPAGYLQELRSAAPAAWIVVEKILEPSEALRSSWPVDGTTGYETLRLLTELLVWRGSERDFDALHVDFTGKDVSL
jgi:(1->4)-alpha-D-glucan 1-alpha-D-glucosylmutase